MLKLYLWLVLAIGLSANRIISQSNETRNNSLDILNYRFEIELNDKTDEIMGIVTIDISFKTPLSKFYLDLKNVNTSGKGMKVDEVLENRNRISFSHEDDKISCTIKPVKKGEVRSYQIKYHGIPSDGLIISKNKYGNRVFFGDCWPNRAHCWLPTVDHPSDKATLEFVVVAPSEYQVVSNGIETEQKITGAKKITKWKSSEPLSTKLMVIGVGKFAVQNFKDSLNIPVSTWVFPQDSTEGFKKFRVAIKPLDYYIKKIGPYPFQKLANVQSKTIYGGMENAGCIFYFENSASDEDDLEDLFAHEIAHQWFGDAVSEKNWHNIWLSEGFATYLTDLYMESNYGKKELENRMNKERRQVINYSKRNLAPVIDTTITNLMDLLNPNSYYKGGWFLHMLRHELGDNLFWQCIDTFYLNFKYKNALTEDFEAVVNKISGNDFHPFFNQWLYQKGHPVLQHSWHYVDKTVKIDIRQKQAFIFNFPLEIKVLYTDGSSIIEKVRIDKSINQFEFPVKEMPRDVTLDPNVWLLFEQ